jgi:hypothetical protein
MRMKGWRLSWIGMSNNRINSIDIVGLRNYDNTIVFVRYEVVT